MDMMAQGIGESTECLSRLSNPAALDRSAFSSCAASATSRRSSTALNDRFELVQTTFQDLAGGNGAV